MLRRFALPARLAVVTAGLLSAVAATTVTGVAVAPVAAAAAAPAVTGNDISWPNCPKGMGIPSRRSEGEPMPSTGTGFVVIGLTNGPGFYPNPCLAAQVAWATSHHRPTGMYAMTTYPTSAQIARYGASGPYRGTGLSTRVANAGYAEARFNIVNARAAGLTNRFVWVDVEDYPTAPWRGTVALHRATVDGAVRAYHDAGISVGVYSIVGMWNRLTGAWRPGFPIWDAVGNAGLRAASARCSAPSFTGGARLLTQWVSGHHDVDITCPGVTGSTTVPSPLAPYRALTLRLGSRGKAVAAVQRVVRATPDGAFGPRTRSLVVAWQRAHRLPATGVVTPAVWRAMGAFTVTRRASLTGVLFTRS